MVGPKDQHGFLGLRFARNRRDRTVLTRCEQRFPLRTTVPMYLDDGDRGMAFVYVQNPTGGVFAGDRLVAEVALEADARAHLTSQSATKLCDMRGGDASQDLHFVLAEQSYLEYVPDALIPQAGARFKQRVRIDIEAGAACVAAELVGPGRRAHGERFAYGELTLETSVHGADGELCVDALRLDPSTASPEAPGLLGDHDYVGSLLAVAPGQDLGRLVERLAEQLSADGAGLAGVAPLPNNAGAVVRLLAASGIHARRTLTATWRTVRGELLGLALPRVRK